MTFPRGECRMIRNTLLRACLLDSRDSMLACAKSYPVCLRDSRDSLLADLDCQGWGAQTCNIRVTNVAVPFPSEARRTPETEIRNLGVAPG
jgi:hypothetical protein